MPSVHHILTTLNAPLDEEQLWALALLLGAHMDALKPSFPDLSDPQHLTFLINANTAIIEPSGHVTLDMSTLGNEDQTLPFLADEVKERQPSTDLEKAHVFSIGALLFTAADFSLMEDEEPSLSEDLEALITQMTDECMEDRHTLEAAIQACRAHVEDNEAVEVLKDLVALAISIEKADGQIPAELLSGRATTSSSPDSGYTQDATAFDETRDLHASLMREIQAKPDLKDGSKRALTGPAPYVTPHEQLLDDIRRSSVASLNKTPAPTPTRLSHSTPDTHAADTLPTRGAYSRHGYQQHGSARSQMSSHGGTPLRLSTAASTESLPGAHQHTHSQRQSLAAASQHNRSTASMGTPGYGGDSTHNGGGGGGDGRKKRMPVRLALDSSALGSILGGLDATTQVKLAFAEQQAKTPTASSPAHNRTASGNSGSNHERTGQADAHSSSGSRGGDGGDGGGGGDRPATAGVRGSGRGGGGGDGDGSNLIPTTRQSLSGQSSLSSPSSPSSSSAVTLPARPSTASSSLSHSQQRQQQQNGGTPPKPQEECSFVGFEEHRHISTTLFKAELDDLMYQNEKQYNAIAQKKLCPICRKTRFTLLTRGRECPMCTRFACRDCRSDVTMPAHMRATPSADSSSSGNGATTASSSSGNGSGSSHVTSVSSSAGKPFTINLCNECKKQLGGIRTKRM
ncbi:hypothetical protein PTSG_08818 [Salpingoeca rosetta]|uniref:KIND domain-containing protein n=1 Tax=Salpingoeca rosetta (strain ATCC 50818 / BSB-021) TaxID=946362 RepID=F2UKS8_SALR5|nr:uncharacterized protein PTSG_08818 [Salpingoeca rosetta]EGD77727.1 hypothetical protein PTSG_08818 [Salpingoeca rosetta]|eukprot:XP_004990203.1 hypothetical protein PTSG_08818 [Salpingoeca rosetta]